MTPCEASLFLHQAADNAASVRQTDWSIVAFSAPDDPVNPFYKALKALDFQHERWDVLMPSRFRPSGPIRIRLRDTLTPPAATKTP